MTWHPLAGTRIWRLLDASGAVLATLEHDAESGQYRDGRGVLCGRRWDEAKKNVEDAVRKGAVK